jgi:hypothetical protein
VFQSTDNSYAQIMSDNFQIIQENLSQLFQCFSQQPTSGVVKAEKTKDFHLQISSLVLDELYNMLLFTGDFSKLNFTLEFSLKVADQIFTILPLSANEFVSQEAAKYYKFNRYLLFLECLEHIYQQIFKIKEKEVFNITLNCKIKKMGNRFAQELYFLEPDEDRIAVNMKLSRKANYISKESQFQMVEGEFVLLTGGEFEAIGFIREITAELVIKLTTNKTIPCDVTTVQMAKLVNITSFIKISDALKSFTTEFCCSKDIHDIVLGSLSLNFIDLKTISEIPLISSLDIAVRNPYLNPSQQEALFRGLKQTFTLIQGPPGTGKTTTAVEIILEWIRIDSSNKILVCADSNIAVDVLYRELCRADVNVYRIGFKTEDLYDGISVQNKYGMIKRAISQAAVICATCVGCTSEYLKDCKFTRVLVDEATQSTELSTIIPLTLGAKQVILIGDHKQLPPTVVSSNAANKGLSVSLFERLISKGLSPILLNTQYRMHPMIAYFPSLVFYDNMIINGVADQHRLPIEGFKWPNNLVGIAFIESKGVEIQEGSSYYNKEEAVICVDLYHYFLKNCKLNFENIGIITPYDRQRRKIKELIYDNLANIDKSKLFVDTVDGFQGMEKELIIFSAVRSNSNSNVGFLRDFRRLNVMLTRAKKGLIIVGNIPTLENDKYWSEYIKWAKGNNLVLENY